jgi:hypothetical protein
MPFLYKLDELAAFRREGVEAMGEGKPLSIGTRLLLSTFRIKSLIFLTTYCLSAPTVKVREIPRLKSPSSKVGMSETA